ncbi:dihydrodipicolinate synthase family protein [Nonomuraea sp. bgisy101]|uniref:dihydrodipicolinate synthase family protein n=1 Tax=Nonomuraea sp. bgisy101 TaxID=3413784 RepID=UPI003D7168DF
MSTAIDTRAAGLRDRLRGALVAAAATPMTRSGEVDLDLAESYFHQLVATGADALAVLAHTGRGPFLPAELRRELILRARTAGVPVIVGVGGSSDQTGPPGTAARPRAARATDPATASPPAKDSGTPSRDDERASTGAFSIAMPPAETATAAHDPGTREPGDGGHGAPAPGGGAHGEIGRGTTERGHGDGGDGEAGRGVRGSEAALGDDPVRGTVADARMAAELGADGVLVFPSAGDRVAEHDAVWQATGLPMIAFDLYTAPCPPAVLAEILRHPGVAGLKTALLSDAMGCQETIALTREAGRLALTGEDRMFGASLLWGAEAALVGIAAASVEATAAVLRAFEGDDLRAFEKASARLDRLAAATFTAPMEGYVQRMLWLAAAEGLIPESHAHDPFGPELPEGERAAVIAASS